MLITVVLPHLFILIQASLLSKRQTSSCPPNCFQCHAGVCRSCNSGWYGQNCSKLCSYCPGGCSQVTGHCLLCPEGTFGPSCSEKCPINCGPDLKGIITCDRTHGHCDSGCTDGFYGNSCHLSCSHCSNRGCVQGTGYCIDGCTAAMGGPYCNITCIPYCVTCNDELSCHVCTDGYTGIHCTRADITSFEYTTPTLSLPGDTSTTGSNVVHSHKRGPSKASIDTAVGISFGALVLILLTFVLVYTNRKKCLAFFKGDADADEKNDYTQTELMFVMDDVGSPRLSRSFLKLQDIGLTTSDSKQEENLF